MGSTVPPDPTTWLNHNIGVTLDTVALIRRHPLGVLAPIYKSDTYQGGYILQTTQSQYEKIASYLKTGHVIEDGVRAAYSDAGLTWPS